MKQKNKRDEKFIEENSYFEKGDAYAVIRRKIVRKYLQQKNSQFQKKIDDIIEIKEEMLKAINSSKDRILFEKNIRSKGMHTKEVGYKLQIREWANELEKILKEEEK